MELSSAPLHKGQLPWRGLLLAASLLILWSSATVPQVTLEAVPPRVDEGNSVVLLVHDLPETVRAFSWYKGENVIERNEIARFLKSNGRNKTGPAYSGRDNIPKWIPALPEYH
ncbi:Carcinoembryonic antigen-related cell adhesion molecule 10 [Lemmus lemmus]